MNISQKIKSGIRKGRSKLPPTPRKRVAVQGNIIHAPNKLFGIINTRKAMNRKTRPSSIRLDIEREFTFHYGLKILNDKYGTKRIMDWYWLPSSITNGLPDSVDDIEDNEFKHDLKIIHNYLDTRQNRSSFHPKSLLNVFIEQEDGITSKIEMRKKILSEFVENVERVISKIIIKYPALKNITEVEKYALFRYHTVGALNNISLSVSPETKREWGINFELFGAFYNTNYEYCGLYKELERRCRCDVLNFKLEPNMTILVNPPYTEKWIETACELVTKFLEQNKNTIIWLVVPVWNKSDRQKLNLKLYDDMPILDAMKHSPYLVSHEIKNLKFFNGLENKHVKLKDHVHVYHLSNRTSIY